MTSEQTAALVIAQSVAALAVIEGMKAANMERERAGYALAYDAAAFFRVETDYCISRDAVEELFRRS